MPPEHKHRLSPFLIQLLEQEQRLFLQAQAPLLVAVHDVEGVLPPVVVDVVAFESLANYVSGGDGGEGGRIEDLRQARRPRKGLRC